MISDLKARNDILKTISFEMHKEPVTKYKLKQVKEMWTFYLPIRQLHVYI